ncbi:MAG: insulinase family protein [Cytophagales bacterium]|nr:insulinase family protein [Cytophagales bacterium]
MKHYFICIALWVATNICTAQYTPKTATEDGYTYTTVSNDPLKTRIYKLQNGLTVYLSSYQDAPRIQTYIAVKAGSKMDPSSLTGLAHYLEHMVFKGTSRIGTYNWDEEQKQLAVIEQLYEKYRIAKDTVVRKKLYKQIDSVSGIAAKYAIANEYDKMLSAIGAQGTNAYTFVEQTVYVNDIPANEIERWATIESERFGQMVPRLFHTELEAVYEEKNRSLDNDMSKVIETTFSAMFPNHQYGSQTTIGTVEHLKNPSVTAIKAYFNTYYVPNNMAICMSGDIDFAKTIKILDATFGKMTPKPVPEYKPYTEAPINQIITRKVIGPSPQSITLCWRFPGAQNKDAMLMEMFSRILANGKAGLMDLDLVQKQKLLAVQSYPFRMKDYSIHLIFAMPRADQSLEDVKKLIIGQIDSIKQGKFDEQLLKAIILNEKLSFMRQLESNAERADYFADAFIKDIPWDKYVATLDDMGKITKKDIVDFANKYYGNNYSEVYKTVGKDETIKKVDKPAITPVDLNREKTSQFYTQVMNKNVQKIEPVFLDFAKDFTKSALANGTEINYKQNTENQIFYLDYLIDIGNEHDPKYALALSYLNYLGTDKMSAEQVKKQFYNLACSFSFSVADDRMQLSLSGLSENALPALKLFEQLIAAPKPDTAAYRKMVDGILKERTDAKLDKRSILFKGLFSYAIYGPKSPFTNIISQADLRKMAPKTLTDLIPTLTQYKHKIRYYGPMEINTLKQMLENEHKSIAAPKSLPAKTAFAETDFNENTVLFIPYDMVQAEMAFIAKSAPYNASLTPVINLYNEYFGGSMSSIVFQEMRESKALAYATFARYSTPKNKDYSYINLAYIGTQADKLYEAAKGMKALLDSVPNAQTTLNNAKDAIINTLRTERITKGIIMLKYDENNKYGINYDIRKNVYDQVPSMTFENIKQFHAQYVKGKKYKLVLIGAKDKIDFKALEKFGKVKELKLEEVFGY